MRSSGESTFVWGSRSAPSKPMNPLSTWSQFQCSPVPSAFRYWKRRRVLSIIGNQSGMSRAI
eukprot:12417613-Alexandrium_andersonii.AAC.1